MMKTQEKLLRSIALILISFTPVLAFCQPSKTKKMQSTDFTTTLLFDQSAETVFDAVNNPRAWWSEEIEGGTNKVNDIFNYHFEDIHRCKIQVITTVPGKKVVWHVLKNDFNFTKDKTEWTDTKINFDISKQGKQTKLVFTHIGLVPEYECYKTCEAGWSHYINGSLAALIRTGKGQPNATGKPKTEAEVKLRTR
jgi:uncharacterized protein YndB with AHSA1/START domain